MSRYISLKIKEITQETPDTVTVHLKQPLFKKVKYLAGQFITLALEVGGQSIHRSYSMSSAPLLDSNVSITVKRVDNGLASNFINSQLKPGMSLQVIPPEGRFTLEPNKAASRHIVLIGAGSGITPLMSILKTVLFLEPNSQVSLIYGNRSEESIIFRQKLEELKEKFDGRLRVVHALTKPSSDWGGLTGRIDRYQTVNLLNKLPQMPKDQTEYYLCGPDGMMDEVKAGLQKLQVPSNRVHFESFTPPVTGEVASVSEMHQVKVIVRGEEHNISVPADKSILEAALDEGIDMPFSCQSGLCTACMGKCISGKVEMEHNDGLSDEEIASGLVLTCIGHPVTDDVVVELD